jgi:hypothetical protein
MPSFNFVLLKMISKPVFTPADHAVGEIVEIHLRALRALRGDSFRLGEQGTNSIFVGEEGVEVGVADAGFERGAHQAVLVAVVASQDVAQLVQHDGEQIDPAIGRAAESRSR